MAHDAVQSYTLYLENKLQMVCKVIPQRQQCACMEECTGHKISYR